MPSDSKQTDIDNEKIRKEILFSCINLALGPYVNRPFDRYIRGLVSENEPADFRMGWCGGDPAWQMAGYDEDTGETYFDEDGHPLCRCWLDSWIYKIEPEYAFFRAEVVRHHIRIALEKIAKERPERAEEAHSVIARYHLDPENNYEDTYKPVPNKATKKHNDNRKVKSDAATKKSERKKSLLRRVFDPVFVIILFLITAAIFLYF